MVKIDFDGILNEWSFRSQTGCPSIYKHEDIDILIEILEELKYPTNFINEFITKLSVNEISDDNIMISYTPKNSKIPRRIKAISAIQQGKDHPAYKLAISALKRKQTKPTDKFKSIPTATKPEPQTQKKSGTDKDKTLKNIDTLKSEAFIQNTGMTDDEFEKKNKIQKLNYSDKVKYKIPNELYKNNKFPQKYLKVLERMMNTKPVGEGSSINHYLKGEVGAGHVSSQAGEILTLVGVSLSDQEFNNLSNSLLKHEQELIKLDPKLKGENTRIIPKSWIVASYNQRKAILKRIKKQYGEKASIMASCWDAKSEVEALGLSDYKKNKGYSTDIFIKVKDSTGKIILDEVSLKKSDNVNLLNSSINKFSDWDSSISDDINVNVYYKKQRNNLLAGATKFQKKIKSLIDKDSHFEEVRKIMKSKYISFDDALSSKKQNRNTSKILFYSMKNLAEAGDKDAVKWLKSHIEMNRTYRDNCIKSVLTNDKLKSGLLSDIASEFPLKSAASGEESLAIGEYSLDQYTCKQIFGTSDYNKIKEKLIAVEGPPPYIGYQAKINESIIPIALISIREDGVGYGGAKWRLDMELDKRFAKILAVAHKKIYGE